MFHRCQPSLAARDATQRRRRDHPGPPGWCRGDVGTANRIDNTGSGAPPHREGHPRRPLVSNNNNNNDNLLQVVATRHDPHSPLDVAVAGALAEEEKVVVVVVVVVVVGRSSNPA